jgi:uncharacterized protein (TIRG00374 family)
MKKENPEKDDILGTSIDEDVEEINEEKKAREEKVQNQGSRKWVKYLINISIILILTSVVLYFNLTGQSDVLVDANDPNSGYLPIYQTIPLIVKDMNRYYFALFIGLVIGSILLGSFILFMFARLYTRRYKYHQAVANNFVGIFYNDITPGNSGGQFAQVYTFAKQGIPISTSASILVMSFIVYQFALLFTGILSMVKVNQIMDINTISIAIGANIPTLNIPIIIFVVLGFLLNILTIGLLLLMSYRRWLHNFILNNVIKFLGKVRLIKNPNKKREMITAQVANFRIELRRLQSNIPFTILIFLITFVSIFLNYSIPAICGYALGGFNASDNSFVTIVSKMFDCFCYMNFQQMITGLIPLPGGAGISEYVFTKLFENGFFTNADFASAGGMSITMLLWRFGTFYIPMIISGIVAATYKSRGLKTTERFYDVRNAHGTFLTMQIQTFEERKRSSDFQYETKLMERKSLWQRISPSGLKQKKLDKKMEEDELNKVKREYKLNNKTRELSIGEREEEEKKK